jgi:hypothetical protein
MQDQNQRQVPGNAGGGVGQLMPGGSAGLRRLLSDERVFSDTAPALPGEAHDAQHGGRAYPFGKFSIVIATPMLLMRRWSRRA